MCRTSPLWPTGRPLAPPADLAVFPPQSRLHLSRRSTTLCHRVRQARLTAPVVAEETAAPPPHLYRLFRHLPRARPPRPPPPPPQQPAGPNEINDIFAATNSPTVDTSSGDVGGIIQSVANPPTF